MTNLTETIGLGVRFAGRRRFLRAKAEDTWALKNISFSLPKSTGKEESKGETLPAGGTLSIVGESGSGKTTLLRALLGLLPPTTGRVEFEGRDLSAMTNEERGAMRRRCGYLSQDPYSSLPPSLTVLGAVLEPWTLVYGRNRREEGLRKAEELLEELKLPDELRNARVRYSLSGGQRQRVALARALILSPDLLLVDEPTAMQDVSTRGEVLEVLSRHVRRGMCMILVTHDLLLARYASSRAMVLCRGEVVEEGDSSALLENPSHSYTQSLLAALPRL